MTITMTTKTDNDNNENDSDGKDKNENDQIDEDDDDDDSNIGDLIIKSDTERNLQLLAMLGRILVRFLSPILNVLWGLWEKSSSAVLETLKWHQGRVLSLYKQVLKPKAEQLYIAGQSKIFTRPNPGSGWHMYIVQL